MYVWPAPSGFALVSDQVHYVLISKVCSQLKCTWVAHNRAQKQGWIVAHVINFCFQWLYYSAATTFSRTSLDIVQKHICEWKWVILSVTWESGSKNEMLWVDTRPNRSSTTSVSLGKGWWFYASQKSQHKSGLNHATYCTNVWQESSLPQFMAQDLSCRKCIYILNQQGCAWLKVQIQVLGGYGSSSFGRSISLAEMSSAKNVKF